MTIRIKDTGCTNLYMRGGATVVVHINEHDNVHNAWTSGKAFVEAKGVYGTRLTIKLAEVQIISRTTAEAMALSDEDDRLTEQEEKARDVTS